MFGAHTQLIDLSHKRRFVADVMVGRHQEHRSSRCYFRDAEQEVRDRRGGTLPVSLSSLDRRLRRKFHLSRLGRERNWRDRMRARLGNRTQDFSDLGASYQPAFARVAFALTLHCDITERDDADQLAIHVTDRKPADLVVTHQLFHCDQVVLRLARHHRSSHYILHLDQVQRSPLRVRTHAEIAIGDHPNDDIVSVNHRDASAIALPHDARRDVQRVSRGARCDFTLHKFPDFHASNAKHEPCRWDDAAFPARYVALPQEAAVSRRDSSRAICVQIGSNGHTRHPLVKSASRLARGLPAKSALAACGASMPLVRRVGACQLPKLERDINGFALLTLPPCCALKVASHLVQSGANLALATRRILPAQ